VKKMPRHEDFERIYQNFLKQYGKEEGEIYYHAWLNKNDLDDTKPYQVEAQYLRESFGWIKEPEIEFVREDKDAKYYKMRALTANLSMNENDYRNWQYMMRVAPSLGWRPLNMNHDHSQWLPYPDARVFKAQFEDMTVETMVRIPKTLPEVIYKLDNDLILHPSIEGHPIKAHYVGETFVPDQYVFQALALLEKGVQLPGDPLTTIEPFIINESLGHSLVESLQGDNKMREQAEPLKVSAPEEQSVTGTGEKVPDCPPGQRWDVEQMKCVPDDVPTGEDAGRDFQTPGPEQTLPLMTQEKWNTVFDILDEMIEKSKEEYWGGRGPGVENCVAYFTQEKGFTVEEANNLAKILGKQTSLASSLLLKEKLPADLKVQGEPIETEPSGVLEQECPPGLHWDKSIGDCVPDAPAGPEGAIDVTIPDQTVGENLVAEYMRETINLKRMVADQTREIGDLKSKLSVEQRDHGNTKRKLQEKMARVAELEKEVLELMENIERREEDLRESDNKKGSLSGRLSAKTREVNKLSRQVNEIRGELEKYMEKSGDLTEENTKNLTSLNETSTKLMRAEEELSKLRKKEVEIQGELAQKTEENAGIMRQSADLSEKLVEQAKRLASQSRTIDQLKTYNADLQEKLKKTNKLAKQIIVKI